MTPVDLSQIFTPADLDRIVAYCANAEPCCDCHLHPRAELCHPDCKPNCLCTNVLTNLPALVEYVRELRRAADKLARDFEALGPAMGIAMLDSVKAIRRLLKD